MTVRILHAGRHVDLVGRVAVLDLAYGIGRLTDETGGHLATFAVRGDPERVGHALRVESTSSRWDFEVME